MRTTRRTVAVTIGVLAMATVGLAGCSAGTAAAKPAHTQAQTQTTPKPAPSATMGSDAAAGLVGPGCAAYAKQVPTGAGSVQGMAEAPVATAADNNPLLTTLVAAVSGKLNPKVNLVDTLNSGQFTVFAPVDTAFQKIPAATLDQLKTPAGAKELTTILTYHVIAGQLSPSQIDGTHKTVEGQNVTIAGSGDDMTVNGQAKVICGGVKTANATVYMLDSVLMPPTK